MRIVGASGLAAVGALHAVWGSGSTWPARDITSLADAVVGSDEFPGAGATFAVATLAGVGAVVVAGAGGDHRVARLVRLGAAAALVARGLLGGVTATRVLGLPEPSRRFRRLDRTFYRPLCLVLGIAAGLAAVADGSRP